MQKKTCDFVVNFSLIFIDKITKFNYNFLIETGISVFSWGIPLVIWRPGRKDGNMKIKDNFILREIAGEHILIPVGEAALRVHGMVTLSESALLLYEKLQSECTEEDLVDVLTAEYEVGREEALRDVGAFLVQMRQVGILEGEIQHFAAFG